MMALLERNMMSLLNNKCRCVGNITIIFDVHFLNLIHKTLSFPITFFHVIYSY